MTIETERAISRGAVRATTAELNKLSGLVATTEELNAATVGQDRIQTFDVTLTRAKVNAGDAVIVPALEDKHFVPLWAAWVCTGSAGGVTLLRLMADQTVVMSQARASCTSGTWVGEKTSNAVVTGMQVPTADPITFDKTGNSLTTTTLVRVVVKGFYI